jgi:nitroreductase
MELRDTVRRRRMVRAFTGEPVAAEVLDAILDVARRGPSAGYSQGVEFVVLAGDDERARYWDAALPEAERGDFMWPGVMRAAAIVVVVAGKRVYLERYAEPDKGWTDRSESHWPVPFWHVDAGMAAMLLLLAVVDAGLGAIFYGLPPQRTHGVASALGIPDGYEVTGFVAIGHPAPDRPSPSLQRGRRPFDAVVHRGHW